MVVSAVVVHLDLVDRVVAVGVCVVTTTTGCCTLPLASYLEAEGENGVYF